jgi:chromosome segregation ATPase
MAGRPRTKAAAPNVDSMMDDILDALEVIKSKLPNGEIKRLQEKLASIEQTHDQLNEDLRAIEKQLLDPEDGIVVRVNKNTDFRRKREQEERVQAKLLDEHKELMSWKSTITRIVWILFSSIAGIIVTLMMGKVK